MEIHRLNLAISVVEKGDRFVALIHHNSYTDDQVITYGVPIPASQLELELREVRPPWMQRYSALQDLADIDTEELPPLSSFEDSEGKR